MKANGLYGGDYSSFKKGIDTPSGRQKIFNYLRDYGAYEGTYDEFSTNLGELPTYDPSEVNWIENGLEGAWESFTNPEKMADDFLMLMEGASTPKAAVNELAREAAQHPTEHAIKRGFFDGVAAVFDLFSLGTLGFGEATEKMDQKIAERLNSDVSQQYQKTMDDNKVLRGVITASMQSIAMASGFQMLGGLGEANLVSAVTAKGLTAAQRLKVGTQIVGQAFKVSAGVLAPKEIIKHTRGAVEGYNPLNWGDMIEDVTLAGFEGVTEVLLPGARMGGNILKKGLGRFVVDPLVELTTEQVSDLGQDFFTWAKDRNLPASSLIGSILSEGGISPEAWDQAKIEFLTGLFLGNALGLAVNQKDPNVKKLKQLSDQYLKENPGKLEERMQNVIALAKERSIPESAKAGQKLINKVGLAMEMGLDGLNNRQFDKFEGVDQARQGVTTNERDIQIATHEDIADIGLDKYNLYDYILHKGKHIFKAAANSITNNNPKSDPHGLGGYSPKQIHKFTSNTMLILKQMNQEVFKKLAQTDNARTIDNVLMAMSLGDKGQKYLSEAEMEVYNRYIEDPQIRELSGQLRILLAPSLWEQAKVEAPETKTKASKMTTPEDEMVSVNEEDVDLEDDEQTDLINAVLSGETSVSQLVTDLAIADIESLDRKLELIQAEGLEGLDESRAELAAILEARRKMDAGEYIPEERASEIVTEEDPNAQPVTPDEVENIFFEDEEIEAITIKGQPEESIFRRGLRSIGLESLLPVNEEDVVEGAEYVSKEARAAYNILFNKVFHKGDPTVEELIHELVHYRLSEGLDAETIKTDPATMENKEKATNLFNRILKEVTDVKVGMAFFNTEMERFLSNEYNIDQEFITYYLTNSKFRDLLKNLSPELQKDIVDYVEGVIEGKLTKEEIDAIMSSSLAGEKTVSSLIAKPIKFKDTSLETVDVLNELVAARGDLAGGKKGAITRRINTLIAQNPDLGITFDPEANELTVPEELKTVEAPETPREERARKREQGQEIPLADRIEEAERVIAEDENAEVEEDENLYPGFVFPDDLDSKANELFKKFPDGNFSLNDVVDIMFRDGNLSAPQITLANAILDYIGEKVSVQFASDPNLDFSMKYTHRNKTITANTNSYHTDVGSDQIFLHEMIHGFIHDRIDVDDKLRDDLARITLRAMKLSGSLLKEYGFHQHAAIIAETNDYSVAVLAFQEAFDLMDEQQRHAVYAFKDMHELVANLYSGTISPEAMELLTSNKEMTEDNLFTEIWKAIRDALSRWAGTSDILNELDKVMNDVINGSMGGAAVAKMQQDLEKSNNDRTILDMREDDLDYTEDQKAALLSIERFIKDGNTSRSSTTGEFVLSGNAGTGKTTIAVNIINYAASIGKHVTVIAPTNRAVKVLRGKLENTQADYDKLATIHAAIYSFNEENNEYILREDEFNSRSIVIVDESSMVRTEQYQDLVNVVVKNGGQIVFMGDDQQLPPVGKGQDPELLVPGMHINNPNYYKMNQVMRQSLNSRLFEYVTALRLSIMPFIPIGTDQNDKSIRVDKKHKGQAVLALWGKDMANPETNHDETIFITRSNKNRIGYNRAARRMRYGENVSDKPMKNDRLMITANTNVIVNGDIISMDSMNGEVVNDVPFPVTNNMGNTISNGAYLIRLDVSNLTTDQKGFVQPDMYAIVMPDASKSSVYQSEINIDSLPPELFQGNGLIVENNRGNNVLDRRRVVTATYGYAITAHKSQGGEWEKVYVHDTLWKMPPDKKKRWIYTAVTRVSKQALVGDFAGLETRDWDTIRRSGAVVVQDIDSSDNPPKKKEPRGKQEIPERPPNPTPEEITIASQDISKGDAITANTEPVSPTERIVKTVEKQLDADSRTGEMEEARIETNHDLPDIDTANPTSDWETERILEVPGRSIESITSFKNMATALASILGKNNTRGEAEAFIKSLTYETFTEMESYLTDTDIANAPYQDLSDTQILIRKYIDMMKRQHKRSQITDYNTFVKSRLRALWNTNQSKVRKTVYDIVYVSSPDSGVQIKGVRARMGSYRDTTGANKSTEDKRKQIERPAILQALKEITEIDGLEIHYINGYQEYFFNSKGKVTKPKGGKRSHQDSGIQGRDLAQILYGHKGLIYLNEFGDKETTPLIKLPDNLSTEDRKRFEDKMLEIHKFYADNAANYTEGKGEIGQKIGNALRAVLEELRLGNIPENIIKLQPETSVIVSQKLDLVKLMKRASMADDYTYMEVDEAVVNSLGITKDGGNIKGMYLDAQGNPITRQVVVSTDIYFYANELGIDTKGKTKKQIIAELNLAKSISINKTITRDDGETVPVTVPLGDFIVNLNTIETTDGLSTFINGHFDKAYHAFHGSSKSGTIKSYTAFNGIMLKHSLQGSDVGDFWGELMDNNNLAVISFSTAEKNEQAPRVSIFDLIDGNNIENQVNKIPLREYIPNKAIGKSDKEAYGLMQTILGSGFSLNNPVIESVDPKGDVIRIFTEMTEKLVNRFNSGLTADTLNNDEKTVEYLKEKFLDSVDAHSAKISSIFSTISGSDVSVEDVRGFLAHPMVNTLIKDRINRRFTDLFKFRSKGTMPVLTADLGFAAMSRVRSVQSGVYWTLLHDPKADIVPNVMVKDRNLRKALLDLKAIEDSKDRDNYLLRTGKDENGESLTSGEAAKLTISVAEKIKQARRLRQDITEAYNKYAEKEGLQPNKESSPITSFIPKTAETKAKVAKEVFRYIDPRTGRLREGYAMISQDVANAQGVGVGDKIVTSITPTDGLRGIMAHQVVGIVPRKYISSNAVVLNSEYIQGVGKDYDIDLVSLFSHDPEIMSFNDWQLLTGQHNQKGLLAKINDAYIKRTADMYARTLGINTDDPSVIDQEKTQIAFMQNLLGKSETQQTSFDVVGDAANRLGDIWKKNIAPVVNIRRLHVFLNNIGLTAKVDGVAIDPSTNYHEAHEAFRLNTNHEVDFPKNTSKLFYNNNLLDLYRLALGVHKRGEKALSDSQVDTINSINDYLFGRLMQLPRNKSVGRGESLRLDSPDPLIEKTASGDSVVDYIRFTRSIARKLMELSSPDTNAKSKELIVRGLIDSMKAAKVLNDKSGEVSKEKEEIAREYLNSLKVKDIYADSAMKMVRNVSLDTVSSAKRSIDYQTQEKIDGRIFDKFMRVLRPKLFYKQQGRDMVDDYKTIAAQMAKNRERTTKEGDVYSLTNNEIRVLALRRAMFNYDNRNNRRYMIDPDSSLTQMTYDLIEIVMPSLQRDSRNERANARKRVFPSLASELFKNESVIWMDHREGENVGKRVIDTMGGKISFSRDGQSIVLERDRLTDGIRITHNGTDSFSSTELQQHPAAIDAMFGSGGIFTDLDSIKRFHEVLNFGGRNITSEIRHDLAVEWFNKRANNFNEYEKAAIFTSLIPPYAARFNEETGKLERPQGVEQMITQNIYKKDTYTSNVLALELMENIAPKLLTEYIVSFSNNNTVDSAQIEAEKKRAIDLGNNPMDLDVNLFPAFNNTKSKPKNVVTFLDTVHERDLNIGIKGGFLEAARFGRLLRSDPEAAYQKLYDMVVSYKLQQALDANPDLGFGLEEVLDDIKNNNYDKFNDLYGRDRDLVNTAEWLEGGEEVLLNGNQAKMFRIYTQLMSAMKEVKSLSSKARAAISKLEGMPIIAVRYGKKRWKSGDDTKLPQLDIVRRTNFVKTTRATKAVEDSVVFNPERAPLASDESVFLSRSRENSERLAEKKGIMTRLVEKADNYAVQAFEVTNNTFNLNGSENAGAMVKIREEISDLAEFGFRDPNNPLSQVQITSREGGFLYKFKGQPSSPSKIAQEIAGKDKRKWNIILAAIELRKVYDLEAKESIAKMIAYLKEVYQYNVNQDTSTSLQNARYVDKMIRRYMKVYEAMDNFGTGNQAYIPHQYERGELERLYKEQNFNKVYNTYVALRTQERKKRDAGATNYNRIADMTDEELAERTNRTLGKQLDKLLLDSPRLGVNPNWIQRIVKDDTRRLYDRQTHRPHVSYVDNFFDTVKNDMIFVESLLYTTVASTQDTDIGLINTMRQWYGNQSSNKNLHVERVSKDKLKRGMEIRFSADLDVTRVILPTGKVFPYDGRFVRRVSPNEIIIETYSGKEKKVSFKSPIEVSTSTRRGDYWGIVENYSKSSVTFNDGSKSVSIPKTTMYSVGVDGQRNDGEVFLFRRRGVVEQLENFAREKGLNDKDKGAITMAAASVSNFIVRGGRFTSRAISTSILGSIAQLASYLRNQIGGRISNYIYNSRYYISTSRKEREANLTELNDIIGRDFSDKDLSDPKVLEDYRIQRALRQAGIAETKYMAELIMQEGDVAQAFAELRLIDKRKDWRSVYNLLRDKAGYSQYIRELTRLQQELYNVPPEQKYVIEGQIADLKRAYKENITALNNQSNSGDLTILNNVALKPHELNERLKITRAGAFKLLAGMVFQRGKDLNYLAFQSPERQLRLTSWGAAFFYARRNGYSVDESIRAAKRAERNTQVKYEKLEKQLVSDTVLGNIATKFNQYRYGMWVKWFALFPEFKNQVAQYGLQAFNPFARELKINGRRVNLGTPQNPRYEKNVAHTLALQIVWGGALFYVGQGFLGIRIGIMAGITDPITDMFYSLIELIFNLFDDDDEEARDWMWTINQANPYAGYGVGTALQIASGGLDPITGNRATQIVEYGAQAWETKSTNDALKFVDKAAGLGIRGDSQRY